MQTTYTDEELPGVSIVWNGGATFNIWVDGVNVDAFTVYGDEYGGHCSAAQAAAAASERLDEIASGNWELYDGRGNRISI